VNLTEDVIKQNSKELVDKQQQDGPTDLAGIQKIQDELHGLMEQEDLKWRQRAKEN
jgi:cytoplasmic iron level regulating protein YaaA (DUF328/UPF0246 family)